MYVTRHKTIEKQKFISFLLAYVKNQTFLMRSVKTIYHFLEFFTPVNLINRLVLIVAVKTSCYNDPLRG